MKKKDHWWNSLLIITAAAAVGGGLMYVAFRNWFNLPDGEIVVTRNWLWLVVGASYVAGWFISRSVEGSFEVIFTKEPFCRTGEDVPKNQEKYPPWLNTLLWAMAYPTFLLLVAVLFGFFLVIGAFVHWLMTVVRV